MNTGYGNTAPKPPTFVEQKPRNPQQSPLPSFPQQPQKTPQLGEGLDEFLLGGLGIGLPQGHQTNPVGRLSFQNASGQGGPKPGKQQSEQSTLGKIGARLDKLPGQVGSRLEKIPGTVADKAETLPGKIADTMEKTGEKVTSPEMIEKYKKVGVGLAAGEAFPLLLAGAMIEGPAAAQAAMAWARANPELAGYMAENAADLVSGTHPYTPAGLLKEIYNRYK